MPTEPRVDFLYDYASPWSYLANEVLPRKLPGVSVRYRPVFLRGLEAFAKGVPYNANKMAYIMKDFARCAAFEKVIVAPPASFPINGVYALRGALVAQERGGFEAYHAAMFHAGWRDSRDISRRDVVVEIAREVGIDAASFGAAIDEPAVKDRLRKNTEEAERAGVFGVPAFYVGEELYWGHDRMDYVARALAHGA